MKAQEKSAQIAALRAEIERKSAVGSGLSARERLSLLFDEGTFVEVGAFVRQRPTEFGLFTPLLRIPPSIRAPSAKCTPARSKISFIWR